MPWPSRICTWAITKKPSNRYRPLPPPEEAASKSSSAPNTLANIIVCYQQLRKPPDVISRYVNQLLVLAPNHPWAAKHADLQASFDRCEAQFLKA